jgi:hypothetical protein
MYDGAEGGLNNALVSFNDLFFPIPQSERYKTLTLSPAVDALLLLNTTRISLEFKLPESILALAPSVPVKDQRYPVAATVDVDAAGSSGAE